MKSKSIRTLMILPTLLIGICLGIISILFIQGTFTDDDKQHHAFASNYKIYSLPMPEKLDFATEAVPLQEMDVRERLDRELLTNVYWQSQTLLWLKRSYRWFPTIDPILKQKGIPSDVKYISLIESGLQNVVSPAGAAGYWQLLDKTARSYGLEVSEDIDERYHVAKATEAACNYLMEAYQRTGSWTMAAASYNAGITGMNRQVDKQYQKNYYDLYLNTETSRYLFRILAAKLICENPSAFGYELAPAHVYRAVPVIRIHATKAIENIARWAIDNHSNYKEIKNLNPWIRKSYFHPGLNSEKNYYIDFPKSAFTASWLRQNAANDTAELSSTICIDEKSNVIPEE